jgi:hypothetical protein
MLALLQRRQREGSVHVGPGADADSVDIVVFQQLLPAVVHPRDVELVRHAAAGRQAAVGHAENLQTRHLLEAGYVAVADVAAGAD